MKDCLSAAPGKRTGRGWVWRWEIMRDMRILQGRAMVWAGSAIREEMR